MFTVQNESNLLMFDKLGDNCFFSNLNYHLQGFSRFIGWFPSGFGWFPYFFGAFPRFWNFPRIFWSNCIDIQLENTNKLWELTKNLWDTIKKSWETLYKTLLLCNILLNFHPFPYTLFLLRRSHAFEILGRRFSMYPFYISI